MRKWWKNRQDLSSWMISFILFNTFFLHSCATGSMEEGFGAEPDGFFGAEGFAEKKGEPRENFRVVYSYSTTSMDRYLYNLSGEVVRVDRYRLSDQFIESHTDEEALRESEESGDWLFKYSTRSAYQKSLTSGVLSLYQPEIFDNFDSYTKIEYDNHGRREKVIHYKSPGDDLIWFDHDDQIDMYIIFHYDNRGYLNFRGYVNGPGPDSKWFTVDDDYAEYSLIYTDPSGVVYQESEFSGPGPDSIWGTADDILRRMEFDTTATVQGKGCRYTSYGAGADELWLTGDDDISYYSCRIKEGGRVKWVYHTRPGPDQLWFTKDDEIEQISMYSKIGKKTYTYTLFDGPGRDGQWGTGDDKIGSFQKKMVEGLGSTIIAWNGPGPDDNWFTADDQVEYYSSKSPMFFKNRFIDIDYCGPGDDEEWFTDDDEVKDYIYTPVVGSDEGYYYYFDTPGEDEIWFNDDDHVEFAWYDKYEKTYQSVARVLYYY